MNHYEQGLAAFHARQFLEAQVHFERATNEIKPEEETEYARYLYECAKVLQPETCWLKLRELLDKYCKQQNWNELLRVLENEENIVPEKHREFIYRYRAQAYFISGALELSRENAIKHVDLLLKKKIYHQLAVYTETYRKWFPYMAYFVFFKIEAHLGLAQYQQTGACIQDLVEMLHRRWGKLEDNQHSSKHKLVETAYESIQNQEQVTGELVLQGHYLYLHSLLLQHQILTKDDWKKVLELLVHEDSWRNLKLALEISLAQNEEEIAQGILKHMKSKKGFSVVKLTKYDPELKTWAIVKKDENSNSLDVTPVLSLDDIKLEDPEQKELAQVSVPESFVDEVDEQKSIELNAIKQLSMNAPGWESLLDILVAYKTMGFKRVVAYLILEAEKMDLAPASFKKKISYMKVVHSLDCNQRYLALSILEEMLGGETIELDEYKELKYVQGSIHLSLGEKEKARLSFAEVEKLDPGYRQLKDRMSRLETN